MKNKAVSTAFLLVFTFSVSFAGLSFVQTPSLVNNSGSWTITFEVNEATDVEAAIVDMRDSSIVRRLAAGVLGSNPPAPFQGGLRQVLTWDGNDDAGNPVSETGSLVARVRAGMIVDTAANFVGGNPYDYQRGLGVAVDSAGSVYIYGRIGAVNRDQLSAVRKFDADNGRYIKTIFPYPAGMDSASAAGWGISMRGDGTYNPKYASLVAMNMSTSIITQPETQLSSFLVDGSLLFHKPVTISTQTAWMGYLVGNDNSAIRRYPGHVRFVMSPLEMPDLGELFLARGSDPNTVYISNAYRSATPSFWAGGRLYRLDMATGAASLWATIIPADSGGLMSSLRGIALDDSGRLFICDSLRQRLLVYDTATWTRLASIPVADPLMVEVNKRTNEIYVLSQSLQETWSMTGNVTLRKFSGFRNPVQTATLSLSPNSSGNATRMAVWQGGDRPIIWIAGWDIWGVRDDGLGLTLMTKFSDSIPGLRFGRRVCYMASPDDGILSYQRLAVDRRTETLYSANGWSMFFQIRDWVNPVPERCRKSTGEWLDAGDAAVSPDGHLYVREGTCWSGPIARYTTDARPVPAPLPSKATNVVDTFYNGKMGSGFGDKGIAVSRTGRVAISEGAPGHACEQCWTRAVEPDGSQSVLLYPLQGWWQFGAVGGASNAGGLKFDYDGNLYVGVNLKYPGAPADWRSSDGVGCVIKFPPSGGFIYKLPAEPKVNEGTPSDSIHGALHIYSQPYSAFSPGLTNPGCGCQNPRFDVDPYGRLFIPNMVKSRVAVADNNGNDIVSFGEYGNIDSKGPGSAVPGPKIPLASPLGVAVSDDFIYIADINNVRLVRARMDFTINNLPWLGRSAAERNGAATRAAPTLMAAPNPFNPSVVFTLSGKEMKGAALKVFDMSGRLITDLSGKMSEGRAVWNAAGMASGMYLVQARKGGNTLFKRIVYAK